MNWKKRDWLKRKTAWVLLTALLFAFCCPATGFAAASGDVNFDGALTSEDARSILRMSVSAMAKPDSEEGFAAADCDGNGKISVLDARETLSMAAGLSPSEVTVTLPAAMPEQAVAADDESALYLTAQAGDHEDEVDLTFGLRGTVGLESAIFLLQYDPAQADFVEALYGNGNTACCGSPKDGYVTAGYMNQNASEQPSLAICRVTLRQLGDTPVKVFVSILNHDIHGVAEPAPVYAVLPEGAEPSVSDLFTYELWSDKAVITGYIGDGTAVTIPSQIEGYTVTEISGELHGLRDNDSLTSVSLPAGVTQIDSATFDDCPQLKTFFVESTNPAFKAENGVLMSADGKTLIQYPAGLPAASYRIPEGVNRIEAGAFSAAPMTQLTIPVGVTRLAAGFADGWERLAEVVYEGNEKQWRQIGGTVPQDVALTFTGEAAGPEEKNTGDIVLFGSYPQSVVADESLIEALNGLEHQWESYGYFSGSGTNQDDRAPGTMQPGDWAKYCDVAYEGERYRGVVFTAYRPTLTSGAASREVTGDWTDFSQPAYELDKVYWFRYEPLRWRVLDGHAGLLLSESILDAVAFSDAIYQSEDGRFFQDEDLTVLGNEYSSSSVREWLNQNFYQTAFSAEEREALQVVTSQNDDCVSLLAMDDASNPMYGFSWDFAGDAGASGTIYARALGLDWQRPDRAVWLLQNAGADSLSVSVIDENGRADSFAVDDTRAGIRPAIRLPADLLKELSEELPTDPDEPAEPVIVPGDADQDGKITTADARLVLRVAVQLEVPAEWIIANCDVDNSGEITTSDARMILRAAVLLEELPSAQ